MTTKFPTNPEIISILRQAFTWPGGGSDLKLKHRANTTGRRDSREKRLFQVWDGQVARAHLVVGPSLSALRDRARALTAALPDISTPVLFFISRPELDFLAFTHAGERNLEEAFAEERIDAETWSQLVQRVGRALAETREPSSPEAVSGELRQLEDDLLALPDLTSIDQVFLNEWIFPCVREGVADLEPASFWTNGDFVARNIVIDDQGRPRLVDYEFSRRSHFRFLDWFRLNQFSRGPVTFDHTGKPGIFSPPRWMELLCWMDHAIKLNQAVARPGVRHDLPLVGATVAQLFTESAGSAFKSVFFGMREAAASSAIPGMPVTGIAPVPATTVQLFLPDREGSYDEQGAIMESLPAGPGWSDLEFALPALPAGVRLRLDPACDPGLVEIANLELLPRHEGTESRLVAPASDQQLPAGFEVGGDCLPIDGDSPLSLLATGFDPVLILPPLPRPTAAGVDRLHLRIRFLPTTSDPRWNEALDNLRDTLSRQQSLIEELTPALAHSEQLLSGRTRELAERTDEAIQLHGIRDELEKQLKALNATRAETEQLLAARTRELAERTDEAIRLHDIRSKLEGNLRALTGSLEEREAEAARLQDRVREQLHLLHAQNAALQDIRHRGELLGAHRDRLSAELEEARARIDRLTRTLHFAQGRLLVRLDREVYRRIAAVVPPADS